MSKNKGKVYLTNSARQTQKIGYLLAKSIIKKQPNFPIIIALCGDLGSGKTTFLQGFAKGLGIKDRILSPTFVIYKRFKLAGRNFYHLDCYRLKSFKDLLSLGFKDILSGNNNIIAVEWPEKVRGILSSKAFLLKFEFVDKNRRRITFAKAPFKVI